MDIGKDLQDAYECGRQDALNELLEYTYAMLTAEKFGLQHKIKSMMADRNTEPQIDCTEALTLLWIKNMVTDEEFYRIDARLKVMPQTERSE
jgi:hypothetical protein